MEPVNINNAGPQIVDDASDVVPASNPDVSQGFPDTNNTPAEITPLPLEPQQPSGSGDNVTVDNTTEAPQAASDGQTPEGQVNMDPAQKEAPDAITERLKQTNAQNAHLLNVLGIDPLSDIGEQLEKGLITPDMVRQHAANKYTPVPRSVEPTVSQPTDPVSKAIAEQEDAQAAYNREIADTGSVSLDANSRVRQADLALYEAKLAELTNKVDRDQHQKQVNESMEAVLGVARDNPEYANMEVPLQRAVDETTLSLTGYLAEQKASEMGFNPATLTPQQYAYFANEATQVLGKLANHYRGLGRAEAKPSFAEGGHLPNNQNVNNFAPNVIPANSDGSPVPINDPYGAVGINNHQEAARRYMRNNKGVM